MRRYISVDTAPGSRPRAIRLDYLPKKFPKMESCLARTFRYSASIKTTRCPADITFTASRDLDSLTKRSPMPSERASGFFVVETRRQCKR
jgi:hypothetical protein